MSERFTGTCFHLGFVAITIIYDDESKTEYTMASNMMGGMVKLSEQSKINCDKKTV